MVLTMTMIVFLWPVNGPISHCEFAGIFAALPIIVLIVTDSAQTLWFCSLEALVPPSGDKSLQGNLIRGKQTCTLGVLPRGRRTMSITPV